MWMVLGESAWSQFRIDKETPAAGGKHGSNTVPKCLEVSFWNVTEPEGKEDDIKTLWGRPIKDVFHRCTVVTPASDACV